MIHTVRNNVDNARDIETRTGTQPKSARRRFLACLSAFGAGAMIPGCAVNGQAPQSGISQLERNKAIALRFKKSQGTKDMPAVEREILDPGYVRLRGGMLHLANNARGQGYPSPGVYLRTAFPDRVDLIEGVIAEGDKVGLLFRLTGTHRGNLFGIPPTGKKVDIYEVAILRLAGGKIVEGWFMADEAGLLKQIGARLPPRKDGQLIVPAPSEAGEDGDVVLQRLTVKPAVSNEERNKIIVARSKSSSPRKGDRAADYKQRRQGFQHLREYGNAHGVGKETPTRAFPDRRDRIDTLLAEGDSVWMQFQIRGTQTSNLYGLRPTGRRVGVPEVGIMRFADGKWKDGWYFGDELGMLLQLGAPNLLFS